MLNAPSDGREHRLALAVAGRQTHAEQLAQLASLARNQMNATAFFDLVEEERRFPRDLRDRLGYLRTMVGTALSTLEVENADDALARDATWRLLTRLYVLTPDVEEPMSRTGALLRTGSCPLLVVVTSSEQDTFSNGSKRLPGNTGQALPRSTERCFVARRIRCSIQDDGVRGTRGSCSIICSARLAFLTTWAQSMTRVCTWTETPRGSRSSRLPITRPQ